MFDTKSHNLNDKWIFMQRWLKLFIAAIVVVGLSACEDDNDEPVPQPEPPASTSTFKLHIGESNIMKMNLKAPDCYPDMYSVVLVMEDLPVDENIIYIGGMYSTENTEPDLNDCIMAFDYSDYDLIQDWDWEKEDLYWQCLQIYHPLPATTYYVRGYVLTDKGEYFSNTIEVHTDYTDPLPANPDAYEIPVIFHLFPDVDGNYPARAWMIREQIQYANNVYGNYYNIAGQTETGIRFVPATHTPDGTLLETPGIVYEKEAVEVDLRDGLIDDKYIWDMEHALNVWICPIKNGEEVAGGYGTVGGFSFFPFFDADEKLEGCNVLGRDGMFNGIFLNATGMRAANEPMTFAHEAGHFLGLDHVFANDFCDDTPWYDFEAHWNTAYGDIVLTRTGKNGETFWSDNIMDYDYSFLTGLTPDQHKRISYTLKYAYFIPGQAGKELPKARSHGRGFRIPGKPVI